MKRSAVILCIFIASILISSCATSIDIIKSNPDVYVGQDVRIRASVTLEAPLPFMNYSVYRMSDDTGTIFLITDKKYRIGQKISLTARVIGVNSENSQNAAEKIAQQTADFMVENNITDKSNSIKLSRKLIRLISALGSIAEGSYFLIAR